MLNANENYNVISEQKVILHNCYKNISKTRLKGL